MKTAILVNGVPASGKSTVSRAVSRYFAVPLLTLDTVKEPLFHHIGVGDREHNRKLGQASYEIIFATIGEWPADALVVVDAWFGFQPVEVLEHHLAVAGIDQTAELWCHAPSTVLADRYAARQAQRPAGHPGLDYVPELVALNSRAQSLERGPCLSIDTTKALRLDVVTSWLTETLDIRADRVRAAVRNRGLPDGGERNAFRPQR